MNTRLIPILLLILAFATPALGETNATYWFNMGMDLYNQNNFSESLKAYDKAIELDPQDAEAWNNKGSALGMLGRYSEALQAFEKATTINSSYAEAWYNMGAIYDLQDNLEDAISAYNKATIIDPSYQKALIAKNYDIDVIMSSTPNCGCNSNQVPASLAMTAG